MRASQEVEINSVFATSIYQLCVELQMTVMPFRCNIDQYLFL